MIKYDNENFDPNLLSDNDIDKIQINMLPPNSRVLEIGCATGFMSSFLRKNKNCFVCGVEYDENQAKVAIARCNVVINGAIDSLSIQNKLDYFVLENGKFDVIFMSQVIEHIAYPDKILIKLKDWLKNSENAAVVISTVNVAHWTSRLRLLFGKWEYEEYGLFDNTHLRFFSVNSFKAEILKAGYSIVEEGYSIYDFSPLFMIPKIKHLTIYYICKKLNVLNSKFFNWYVKKFKNFIAYQFVFKIKKV